MNIKGTDKDLRCKGKQYVPGETSEESEASLCNVGMHYVESPGHVFSYYAAGISRFFEVEPSEISEETRNDDSKRVCKRLKIGAEISTSAICKIAVNGFFEWFKFGDKIKKAKESTENNAGDYGAANAGDCGAANAGYKGAANAGYKGAANAGDYGAAIVQSEGTVSVGEHGLAVCMGNNSKAKGKIGTVMVFINRNNKGEIVKVKSVKVDGKKIKPDTWYKLVDGQFAECE